MKGPRTPEQEMAESFGMPATIRTKISGKKNKKSNVCWYQTTRRKKQKKEHVIVVVNKD